MTRRIACQYGGEIEPEAVHVHLRDPVPKAVHDHPTHDRVICIQRVPGAAVIGVPGTILLKDVIRAVVYAPITQRWTAVVALGRVIEDDVENDFDTRAV